VALQVVFVLGCSRLSDKRWTDTCLGVLCKGRFDLSAFDRRTPGSVWWQLPRPGYLWGPLSHWSAASLRQADTTNCRSKSHIWGRLAAFRRFRRPNARCVIAVWAPAPDRGAGLRCPRGTWHAIVWKVPSCRKPF